MKRIVLLTTTAVLLLIGNLSAQNVFDQNDSVVTYNSGAPSGSVWNPVVPNNGTMAKWIRTTAAYNGRQVTFNTTNYKAYIWNGMPFRLIYPKTYQQGVADGKIYPIVVFWHGGGEIAPITNNELQLYNGGDFFQAQIASGGFDGFMLFPQETAIGWEPYFSRVNDVLDTLYKWCKVDPDRVISMGLSIGGQGSMSYANQNPKRVSKIVASSPTLVGTLTPNIPSFLQIPLWMASGGLDTNPDSASARAFYNSFKQAGGNVIYDFFPLDDHHTWNDQWAKPYFLPQLNSAHKANPLVYFQNNLLCPDSAIKVRMGLTAGFFAYQWDLNGTVISGATSSEYTATAYGTYRARFQRTATSGWSAWSPSPVTVLTQARYNAPAIAIQGIHTNVLPGADSSYSVPLMEPAGYVNYRWVRAVDTAIMSSSQVFNAPSGQYKAAVMDGTGCYSSFTPVYTVVNANGAPKPDRPKNLNATQLSGASILLDWAKNSVVTNAPTSYEVYRGTKAGGPFTYVGLIPGTSLSYTDNGLTANTTYYYIIRPINGSAAGAVSNEATATTQADVTAPTAPSNLVAGTYTTRQSVDLSWSAASDNVGVYKYDIYVNGVKMYSTDSLFTTVYNLTPLTSFVFTVKARDKAGNVSQPSNQVIASTALVGLKWRFYQNYYYNLPNFYSQTVVSSGISSNVDISVRPSGVNDQFGFVWEGYIKIPQAGTYTFGLKSDDGSAMWVNSFYDYLKTPTVNNDGAHDNSQTKTGTYTFPAGGVYPFAVSYFEQAGSQSIALTWSGPGVSSGAIPSSAFTDNVSAGSAPLAPSLPTATVNSYRQITVGWKDNSTTETGFEIVRGTANAGPFTSLATTAAGAINFIDTFALNPSTAYYYKIRAVGTGGASAFTSVATTSTQAAPAAPGAPSGLGLVVNSSKQITLNWTDNSGIETAMEVWRSSNDNTNYRVIATLNPNTVNYVDATVLPNETYLYKVRAKIVGNNSAFSNEVTGRSLDLKPTVTPIADFTMKYGTTFVLPIKASDPDNDDIAFTYLNKPVFATPANVSNGNATLTFTPTVVTQGTFTIAVVANDNNGKTDTMRFTLIVNSNNPPTIATINNITIDEGTTSNVAVSATDPEGNANITWAFTGLPSFVTFTNNGNGNGTMAVAPGYAASGVYNVTATVNDGFGGKANKAFTITVNDKSPNTKWYVKVYYPGGGGNSTAPAPWNNVGGVSTNLLNSSGGASTVGVTISAPNNITLYSSGQTTGNNSGVFPDVVLRDCFYLSNPSNIGNILIKNLNPSSTYNFRLLSSTNDYTETALSRTVFSSGGKMDSVLEKNNTTNTASLAGIAPDASGNINIQWYRGAAAGTRNAYINAFIIEQVYDDGTAPAKAQGIGSVFIPGSGAKVTWKDIAYNETSYKVYRSSTSAGPYTQLNPGATNQNDSSYLDATATPNATYYYYVVASNNVGNSPSSDTTTLVTGNNPPIIGTITDLYVKAGSSASITFAASDDPGDVLSATSPDMPTSFAALTGGPTSYTVTANPGLDNVGFYKVTINVADNKGGVTKKTFNILVSDNGVKTALVKFGGLGFTLPKPWNNVPSGSGFPVAGLATTSMTDDGGGAVRWNVQLVTQFDGYYGNGFKTGNDAGVVPDTVMFTGIYCSQPTTPRTFKLTGLDPNKKYSVGFVSGLNSGYNYTATVSSGAKSVTFNGSYNANNLPRLNGLVPAADSSVSFNVLRASNSQAACISALIIQEYDPVATPNLSPSNLIVEPADTNKIRLTWSDRGDGETGIEVYRSTAYGGTYTLVATTAANAVTYTDVTPAINTRYYYKVRVKNGAVFSAYSNIATTTSPSNIIYVNMKNSTPGGSPWNNTGKAPAVGDVYGLRDPKGNYTGYTMTVVNNFSSSGSGGSSTGTNSGVFPDSVMVSNFVIATGTTATVKFSNLDQSKRYRVGFSGSSNTWANSFNTTYSIGNRTVYLNALYDTIKAVYIDGVIPNSNGEITANISTTSDAAYGLLNAIVLQAYTYVPGGSATDNPVASQAIRVNTGVAADSAARRDSTKRSPADLSAYPNPFNDYLNLQVETANTIDKLDIEIFDSNGKIMFAKVFNSVPSGTNTIRISAADAKLQQGIYFMRVHSSDGATNSVIKLIKINK
ncbi:PA14 domain-containing protein [Chitinophagaceae bacterium 26-R-25]|nr:PA14 domain-containing protein [Chitinophagaceae bacterium 26-R-25]